MSTVRHAQLIPLIGGMAIGSERAFGSPPDAILSFDAFAANETHLRNWYRYRGVDVPSYDLARGAPTERFDVIGSTCPCAGLSSLSPAASSDNPTNRWLLDSTRLVLSEMRPLVYWGENAPGLAGSVGRGVRESMLAIAAENGYSMTIYRTRSLAHGLPQVRERSFFFFWRDGARRLEWFARERPTIEGLLASVRSNSQTEPINQSIPTSDPYYAFALEKTGAGSHAAFVRDRADTNCDMITWIERHQGYDELVPWLRANGYEKAAGASERRRDKIAAGGSAMRRGVIPPRDYIGAFVGQVPTTLTHPTEDRFVSYRESMAIMGLPDDFELLDPKRSVNHVCQNVPVQTATDMAGEVLAAIEGRRERIPGDLVFQHNGRNAIETVGGADLVGQFC